MTGKVELIRHISLEELDELIKNERDSKVLRKLSFIRLLYKGESVIIVIVSIFYTSGGFLKTTIKTYLANEHIV